MKKVINLVVLSTMLFVGSVFAGDKDYPPEVPPCPDPYKDGLKS